MTGEASGAIAIEKMMRRGGSRSREGHDSYFERGKSRLGSTKEKVYEASFDPTKVACRGSGPASIDENGRMLWRP